MMRSAALALALVLGLSLAWLTCRPPPPAPAGAPAASFSAERAFADKHATRLGRYPLVAAERTLSGIAALANDSPSNLGS